MRTVLTYKWLAVALLGTAAAVFLAACGGGGSSSSTESSTGTVEGQGSAAGKKIALVGDSISPTTSLIECEEKRVVEEAGADYEYQFPDEYNAAKQVAVLNSVAATQPDVLIVSPDDPNALVAPLKQIASQGTPIVLQDHELADKSIASATVVGDSVALGEQVAEILAEAIGDKEGEVALLGYTPGASTITDGTQKGFKEKIAEYPNLEFIGMTVMKSLSIEEGSEKANALMSSHPNLVGLGSDASEYAVGAVEAIDQRGLGDQIKVAQADASPKTVELIQEGKLAGLSSPDWATIGKEVGEAAVALAAGEEPEKYPLVPPIKITPENVNGSVAKRELSNPTSPC